MPGFIAATTCIPQGLQSNRSVYVSSPLFRVIGSVRIWPCPPLACFGQRLNEMRRQCLVIISATARGSWCASQAPSIRKIKDLDGATRLHHLRFLGTRCSGVRSLVRTTAIGQLLAHSNRNHFGK